MTYVSLYGEVQKEVIRDALAAEFGLEIDFAEATPPYIERPSGEGSFFEEVFTPSNPFVATIGMRTAPDTPLVAGGISVVTGDIPAGDVNGLQAALPGLTRGEGVMEVEFGPTGRTRRN
ncbi:hypothetical protein [Actinacidiphila yeochonensis]|uniref:hypothetical protein n=1 Tax=Actinacidiphila yeochonensis TaxID=89050 RepID=UPI000559E267|nr:hypothetical protein [Actinacidiphila yeochonensis]